MNTPGLLPVDAEDACLVGRVWDPRVGGPVVVSVRGRHLVDLTPRFPTIRDLLEEQEPVAAVKRDGRLIGDLDEVAANTAWPLRGRSRPWLLAPIDLQVVKAAGVTFAVSMIERVIEEYSRGDPRPAAELRQRITALIGTELKELRPGSEEAARVKAHLIGAGLWSQYLEVGIGPDAELFTKAPVLAAVGTGSDIGVLETSAWNNPEPEIVLVVNSHGTVAGATLGNDVNHRDIEGRSALLLGKAKDSNCSAAVGPFIRLFDARFGMDDIRTESVGLAVEGTDGFRLDAVSTMTEISRDPGDLATQLFSGHQYPDGAALYLGTLFAPVQDREETGRGFTHRDGDLVRIFSRRLGCLVNRVRPTGACDPWTFGIAALYRNLSERGIG
ncbi:MAG: fumarylacetoacetate hydrolase family protein [Propionicimonas sp.]